MLELAKRPVIARIDQHHPVKRCRLFHHLRAVGAAHRAAAVARLGVDTVAGVEHRDGGVARTEQRDHVEVTAERRLRVTWCNTY